MGIILSILKKLYHSHISTGEYGERIVISAIRKVPGYSRIVSNVYIPYNNQTKEIDVVMVHERGLFVFESKNYSGWIFGNAEQQKWTQCLKSGDKHQFYNPLKQNANHCKALGKFLDVSSNIFSYIVFSKRCTLKEVPINTLSYTIVQQDSLLRLLRKHINDKPIVFTRQQVDDYAGKLINASNITKTQKKAHINAIKERTEGTVCPYCGAELVRRDGKYGAFWGCSNYPRCKFTRK